MTRPMSVYPRHVSGTRMKKGLLAFNRLQRERFFLLVVRMVGRRVMAGKVGREGLT